MWPCCNFIIDQVNNEHYYYYYATILIITLSLLTRSWLARRSVARVDHPPLPPGPRGLPFLGYLPFVGPSLHREFAKLAGKYGPIYKLRLGKKLCIVVSSPSLVRQIVRDHDTVFANHDLSVCGFIASFEGNDIVVTPYGREWKKLRRIFVQQMLSGSVLDSLYGLRREEIHNFIRVIFNDIKGSVDIGRLAYSMVLDKFLSMFWGREVGGVVDQAEFKNAASKLLVLLGKPNVSELFPALEWLDIQGIGRETKNLRRTFEVMFDSAIELKRKLLVKKKEEGETRTKDFLEFLLETLECEDDSESISMDQLKGILMDVVVGGVDTTVTTIEWAMTELLKHPEEMKNVQQELSQVVGLDKMVEEFHTSKLTYLIAVIKETLRLHPPFALLIPRRPSEPAVIGGYYVPKTAKVFLNVWSIHRDPEIWDSPLEFRPSRFLNKDAAKFDYSGNNSSFIPFGSGRRVCAGIPLAERVLNYTLASLLHSFKWKLPPGASHDLSDKFGIVLRKREPLVVVPSARLSNLDLYTRSLF